MWGWIKKFFSTPEADLEFDSVEILTGIPRSKVVKKYTRKDLEKLTKRELELLARENFNTELDRRRRKSDLIEQVLLAQLNA